MHNYLLVYYKSWKALLLYDLLGRGKTVLAKAVATECKTTFFNISALTIAIEWLDASENLVRVLFEAARFHASSALFLDKLDAIMSQHGSDDNARLKLDHAMLRRLEKRVLVDLSTKEAQETIFQQFLPPTVICENNGLGYSGVDIILVCKEAAMNLLRQVFDILETLQDDPELSKCIQLDSITTTDVEKVLSTIKLSTRAFKDKYIQCQKEFESV
ncbi:unnamed protein product [Rotaria sp. Silwood1]|nr:unnamed protein product [Rotaria sp. Silwood1]